VVKIEYFLVFRRFKSSERIWVRSIGMNSTSAAMVSSTDDTVIVQIELKDKDRKVLATKMETVTGVKGRTSEVYHVEFKTPVLVVPDDWHFLSFTVKSVSN